MPKCLLVKQYSNWTSIRSVMTSAQPGTRRGSRPPHSLAPGVAPLNIPQSLENECYHYCQCYLCYHCTPVAPVTLPSHSRRQRKRGRSHQSSCVAVVLGWEPAPLARSPLLELCLMDRGRGSCWGLTPRSRNKGSRSEERGVGE